MAGSRIQKQVTTTLVSFCEYHSEAGPCSIYLDKQTLLCCDLENGNVPSFSVTQFPKSQIKLFIPMRFCKENWQP